MHNLINAARYANQALPHHLKVSAAGGLQDRSFSGVDIKVGIMMPQQNHPQVTNPEAELPFQIFAELQTLTITSFRSTGPVRCLGESQPRAILRGARTIGGSLVFAQFDQNAFWRMMRVSEQDEVYNPDEPFFIDQIPPFDIVAYGSNEYGNTAMLMVGGVILGQTGTTLSVHDIYTESTYSYTARYYIPWSPAGSFRDQMRELWWENTQSASARAEQFARSLGGVHYGEVLEFEGPEAWQLQQMLREEREP